MKLDATQATNAERGEAILMLEAAELALDGGTATVDLPWLRLARNERVQAVGLDPLGLGGALSGRQRIPCSRVRAFPGI